jgi:hypothetical protein
MRDNKGIMNYHHMINYLLNYQLNLINHLHIHQFNLQILVIHYNNKLFNYLHKYMMMKIMKMKKKKLKNLK